MKDKEVSNTEAVPPDIRLSMCLRICLGSRTLCFTWLEPDSSLGQILGSVPLFSNLADHNTQTNPKKIQRTQGYVNKEFTHSRLSVGTNSRRGAAAT